MSTTLKTKINIFYRDPEGERHTVVKTIWGMNDRSLVTAIQITYPDGVTFPIECSYDWIIPPGWQYVCREWDYIQQNVLNTPSDHLVNTPDRDKMTLKFKDPEGGIHSVVKHILGKKDEKMEQWNVKAIRFGYPNDVKLPMEDYHCRIIPRGWEFVHGIQENRTSSNAEHVYSNNSEVWLIR